MITRIFILAFALITLSATTRGQSAWPSPEVEQMYKQAGGPSSSGDGGATPPQSEAQTTQEQKDVIDAEFEEHQ